MNRRTCRAGSRNRTIQTLLGRTVADQPRSNLKAVQSSNPTDIHPFSDDTPTEARGSLRHELTTGPSCPGCYWPLRDQSLNPANSIQVENQRELVLPERLPCFQIGYGDPKQPDAPRR